MAYPVAAPMPGVVVLPWRDPAVWQHLVRRIGTTSPGTGRVTVARMFPMAIFTADCHCFAKGSVIEFREGVNPVVGDQGAGKSTLLRQMALWVAKQRGRDFDDRAGSVRDLVVSTSWEGGPGSAGYFDFEKHNPRTAPAFDMFGYDAGTQMASFWQSHGQTMRSFLGLDRPHGLGKGCLILDEPDMALSPRSIRGLAEALKASEAAGGQIIASVHNPLLIAAFPEVLSLEHGRWMPSAEFLDLQATTPAPAWDPKVPRRVEALVPGSDFFRLAAKRAARKAQGEGA